MVNDAEQPAQFDEEAGNALEAFSYKFRLLLADTTKDLWKARKQEGPVTPEHVELAYFRLTERTSRPRTDARRVVANAFKENRFIELVAYGMAASLFFFGLAMLAYAVFGPADTTGRISGVFGGTFAQLVLLIPLRLAVNARRHNFAIRILGLLLDRIDDPALLADLIRQLLDAVAPKRRAE